MKHKVGEHRAKTGIPIWEKVGLGAIAALALASIGYQLLFWGAPTVRKIASIASFWASLATIIGVGWAIINVRSALRAYKSDHSIRKQKIITKLYDIFLEDNDLYELYEIIKINGTFDLDAKNRKALNRALTLFDEIDYFMTEKLFDDSIWEYIAYEIVNLSRHEGVQEFLRQTWGQYTVRQKDMLPFTGFKALVEKLDDKYWFKPKPDLDRLMPT